MFRIFSLILGVALLMPTSVATALRAPDEMIPPQVPVPGTSLEQSAFRSYADLTTPVSSVPEVLEVDMSDVGDERRTYEVYDLTADAFVPSRLNIEKTQNPVPKTVRVPSGNGALLVDGDTSTAVEFPFEDDGTSMVSEFTIMSAEPVTADTLTLLLDNYVALPHTIAVSARMEDGSLKTLIAPRTLGNANITFPRTTARTWEVMLRHSQPLRLTEVTLRERNVAISERATLRFLALPAHTYRVYANADRSVSINYLTERPQFDMSEQVRKASRGDIRTNAAFVPSDADKDGIEDVRDNCVSVANADQVDVDKNYKGDACDDFDKDGRMNNVDNCVSTPNANQRDTDADDIGDACDQEESRFTEKHAWVPWVGIGFAALVILVLFALTLRMKPEGQESI